MCSTAVLRNEVPVRSAVNGSQDRQAVIRVRRTVGFSRSNKHHALRGVWRGTLRLHCNRANRERHLIVSQGGPGHGGGIEAQCAGIARFPNTSISAADKNGVACLIIRVDCNRGSST